MKLNNMKYVDFHCHCAEFSINELRNYVEKGVFLVCVSEDNETSYKTIKLREELGGMVYPCVGIHPWEANKYTQKDAEKIVELAVGSNIRCIGEVGLDKRFVPQTIDRQRELFNVFLKTAREYDMLLNLHTAGTWKEVYSLLLKHDINRAYFHWYTGPLSLLEEIEAVGYFVGVNPAWRIQEKHRRVIMSTDLASIITESDGPYKYKGMMLNPLMVIDTIDYIADVKGLDKETVVSKILSNMCRALGLNTSR